MSMLDQRQVVGELPEENGNISTPSLPIGDVGSMGRNLLPTTDSVTDPVFSGAEPTGQSVAALQFSSGQNGIANVEYGISTMSNPNDPTSRVPNSSYSYGQVEHMIPPQNSQMVVNGGYPPMNVGTSHPSDNFVAVGHPIMHSQFAPNTNGGQGISGINMNTHQQVHGDGMQVRTMMGGHMGTQSGMMGHMPQDNSAMSNQYVNVSRAPPSMMPMQSYMHPTNAHFAMSAQPVGGQANSGFPKQPSAKAWHKVGDHRLARENISEEIIKLLKSRRANGNDNSWQEKLPQMVRRLEEALYLEANTFEDYSDKTTLKQRLQQLAIAMGGSKNTQQRASSQGMQNNLPVAQRPVQTNLPTGGMAPTSAANYNMVQGVQQMPPVSQFAGQMQHMPNLQPHLQHQQPTGYSNTSQFMSRQAPTAGQYQSNMMGMPTQGQVQMPPQGRMMTSTGQPMLPSNSTYGMADPNSFIQSYSAGPVQGHGMMQQALQQPIQSQPMVFSQGGENDPRYLNPGVQNVPMVRQMASKPSTGQASNPSTDEHRKQVLKQQQQRLLLLRHASKCPHEHERCPVTPHCWNMKLLWKHIMSCKDQECRTAHCVSSRYVLSHYSKCKDQGCPVCGPVREAIKRNHLNNPHQKPLSQDETSQVITTVAPVSAGTQPSKTNKRKLQESNQAPMPTTLVIKPKSIFPVDPISSSIYSFTNEQVQAHIKSIQEGLRLTVAKIKDLCKPLIEEMLRIPLVHQVFGSPVDPIALNIPDYREIIKHPMDLGTIMKRLDSGSYRDLNNIMLDVHLTFNNAMTFNPEKSDVYNLAKTTKKDFDSKFKKKVDEFERFVDHNRQNDSCCLFCGEADLKFEPPVYYCNGPCCQKIKRNSTFYGLNNNFHFCTTCYNQMKDQVEVRLPEVTFKISELTKKKHTEESDEGWVECDGCKRWVHQVCALFNNRRNFSIEVPYVCPHCIMEKRKKSPEVEIVAQTTKKMRAVDLPKTTLSDFLEKRIAKRLQIAYDDYADSMGISSDEVEKCPELVLRQVSCVDKAQVVREGVLNRYKDKNYPAEFPCRTKCLVLFQNIDGQDVVLFGMYVYEYGHKCPQPNQRRVYISYLDSVHYLRPKQYRTLVYHEILISYLDYVKARGFHTAHIWACPPQKGDDYILYVHPSDQKTPKPQTLRIWYDEMLKRCVERGIVVEVSDLHTEFLANVSNEATVLPYFEGDYWVNEAEVIIKNLKDGKKTDDYASEDAAGKSKRRSKVKRAPPVITTGVVGRVERDPVMAKLAAIIEPMKDTFFVARLYPKEFADKFAIADESVMGELKAEESQQSERALQEEALSGQDLVPSVPSEPVTTVEADSCEDDFTRAASAVSGSSESGDLSQPHGLVMESANDVSVDDSSAMDISEPVESAESKTDDAGPIVFADAQPPAVNVKLEESNAGVEQMVSLKRTISCAEDMPQLPSDTEDVDDVMECEHFDTRQQFLNLCQGNHYQFDQLRRAKHSTMMVLYHLHNPDAPKFVPTCHACAADILTGFRHHCEKCDMDFCNSCYQKRGSGVHLHPLRSLAVGTAPPPLTEEQRKERQRSIQLHMQLLNHAAICTSCTSNNCAKMKQFLKHEQTCKEKKNGCRLCSRVSNLLNIHARNCRTDNCKVPQCSVLKALIRQNDLRQQQMDDRRRQQMNSEYGRSAVQDDD